jgi:hemoglobin
MMKDIMELKDIQLFVDQFYQKVREDQFIGPIFLNQIEDWESHLNKMYAFLECGTFWCDWF